MHRATTETRSSAKSARSARMWVTVSRYVGALYTWTMCAAVPARSRLGRSGPESAHAWPFQSAVESSRYLALLCMQQVRYRGCGWVCQCQFDRVMLSQPWIIACVLDCAKAISAVCRPLRRPAGARIPAVALIGRRACLYNASCARPAHHVSGHPTVAQACSANSAKANQNVLRQ